MAWILFLKNDFINALPFVNKAIELAPNNSNAIDTRGCISFGLKNYKNALEDFNKAIEINPKSANSYLYRGRIYNINNEKPAKDSIHK